MSPLSRPSRPLAAAALCVPLLAATVHAQAPAREPFPGLDAYVTKAMADWKVPGVGLAIIRNDSVLYARGYGVRNLATGEPADGQTLFGIGSTTKAFTTASLAMLADSGRLAFDAPVTTYLPGFELYDPVITREVTVRDIVTHRTGITTSDNLTSPLSVWIASGVPPAEIVRRLRFIRPVSSFRSQFNYSNVMYIVAGEVLASVAGMRWEEFVARRIFAPLGMTRSVTTDRDMDRLPNAAAPHHLVDGAPRAFPVVHIDNAGPAGSINSTPNDMAQWVRLQLGQGTINGRTLFSRRMAEEMHRPQTITRFDPAANPTQHYAAYGLGWSLQDYRGRAVVQHGGGLHGFTAHVAMLPEEKFGVVVLANLEGTGLPSAVARQLLDLQLKAPPRDWSAEAVARAQAQPVRDRDAPEASRSPASPPSLPLARYAGRYVDSLYGTIEVTEAGGALRMTYGPHKTSRLTPWSGDHFRAQFEGLPMRAFFMSFRTNPDSTVSEVVADQGGRPVTFTRAAPPARGAPPR